MAKHPSIFDALADKSKKPDAFGFQPIDPAKWEAVKKAMSKRP